MLTRMVLRTPEGVTMVGIDELTALVGGPKLFTVAGHQAVWLLGQGRRQRLAIGDTLELAEGHQPHPARRASTRVGIVVRCT